MARLTSSDRPVSIRYKKLSNVDTEIRVLEIQPARCLEDAIVSHLITITPSKTNLEFIGLSSLTGDLGDRDIIYIDGKPVKTTAHRALALRQLRDVFLSASPDKRAQVQRPRMRLPQRLRRLLGMANQKLYVWLDCICINHRDDDETNHHKETMKMAYQSAKTVLGWLGPKIDSTDLGLAVFSQINDCMPRTWGDPGDNDLRPEDYSPTHDWAKNMRNLWQCSDDGTPAFLLPHWTGANDFMYRTYFQKQWILQELGIARCPAFLIGDRVVPWRTILRLVRCLEEFKNNESDEFPSEYRAAVAELPLGSCYELLQKLNEQITMGSVYESEGSGDFEIWGTCGEPPVMPGHKQILAWAQSRAHELKLV